MKITKALIIGDPWIGYILDGSKTWEMRSRPTTHRGWFGVIRKGTGAVQGIARIVDVGKPLSPAGMLDAVEQHRIPERKIRSGEIGNWNTPWKLANIRRLDEPVPYRHKNGAVTWVVLDSEVTNAIERQLDNGGDSICDDASSGRGDENASTIPQEMVATPTVQSCSANVELKTASVPDASRLIGEIKVNQANIDHDHFYLRHLIDKFPPEAIGGSNKAKAAKQMLIIDWGAPEQVRTDIDGSKKLFRARGWIGAFFRLNRAKPGDLVVIKKAGRHRYQVRLRKINGAR